MDNFLTKYKSLSRAEQNIAFLICSFGLTNREIGDILYRKVETIKFHKTKILKKMKVTSSQKLICFFYNYLIDNNLLKQDVVFKKHLRKSVLEYTKDKIQCSSQV